MRLMFWLNGLTDKRVARRRRRRASHCVPQQAEFLQSRTLLTAVAGVDEMLAENMPDDELLVDEVLVEEMLVDEVLVEEMPFDEMPVDEKPEENIPPVAVPVAGNDGETYPGLSIFLEGADSYDPDNGPSPLSYEWRYSNQLLSYSSGYLLNWAEMDSLGWAAGNTYSVDLTVYDGEDSHSDSVEIEVLKPEVWIAVTSDTDMSERISGVNSGKFRVERYGNGGDLTVSLDLSGTASSSGPDKDYTMPTSVTIPDGQFYVDVTVVPINDLEVEGDETVVATVKPTSDYTISTAIQATLTLRDNDSWEWASPSNTVFGSSGTQYYSKNHNWSDGSLTSLYGQVVTSNSSVLATLVGSHNEVNFLGSGGSYTVSDSRLIEFDFDEITGDIFLSSASAPGVIDRQNPPLSGGLGMTYSINNLPNSHSVTITVDPVAVYGDSITWTMSGGLTAEGSAGSTKVTGGIGFSVSGTATWAKQLTDSFATTLALTKVEAD